MTYVAIHEPKREMTQRAPIDVWGLTAVTVWLSTMQVVLQEGQHNDWFRSPLILGLSVISLAALVAFLWIELRIDHPFINLRIFKDHNFTVGNLMGVVVATTLFGSIFLIPIFSSTVLGYTALQIGLNLLPAALATLPMFALVARLSNIVDPRFLVSIGFVGLTYSCWLNSHLDANISFWALAWLNTTRSLALPFIFVPLTAIGVQRLPQQQKPEASALYNLTRTLGGSLAIAALGTFLVTREAFHFQRYGEHITAFATQANNRLQSLIGLFMARGGVDAQTARTQAYATLHFQIQKQALIGAFDDAFYVLMIISAIAVVLAFYAKPLPRAEQSARPALAAE
jgi:DHA2 family multidrug resistance protein